MVLYCWIQFEYRKTKKEYDWRMVYVEFNFNEEISRGTSELCDNFSTSNTVMLGSVGLISSLPQFYLAYLDSLPMKKMAGWVQPPKKWNQMKRAMVKAARTLNMTTLRMKSLVSDVGLKIRGRGPEWSCIVGFNLNIERPKKNMIGGWYMSNLILMRKSAGVLRNYVIIFPHQTLSCLVVWV